MKSIRAAVFAFLSLICGSAAVQAQIPSLGSHMPQVPSGVSSLTGGLPNLSSMSPGNAAGIVKYCLQNNYLSGDDANATLSGLASKQGVGSSSDYQSGEDGKLGLGNGSALSMDSMQGQAKTKVCNLALKHAKSLL